MADALNLWERPQTEHLVMIVGWRQWADAGSVSSGLPEYLIRQTDAHKIGELRNDGFYLFQIPGMHDLVRPFVKFSDGYVHSLETQHNDFFYTGDAQHGVVFFLGDEPNIDVERYIAAILDAATLLGVERIVGLGGVYGELPYDRERTISANYSLRGLRAEMDRLAVVTSDYQGGASIGSFICRRAGDRGIEYIGLYAFVPLYDFSALAQHASTIRIENDYMAWLGIVRRLNFMLKTRFLTGDLERKSAELLNAVESKIRELENMMPQLGVREYLKKINDGFVERPFDRLDDVWESELRRLFEDEADDE